jgi:hypothetical protein
MSSTSTKSVARARPSVRGSPALRARRSWASDESIRHRLRAALDENKRLREGTAALREELALALAHGRVRELELATRAGSAG